MMASSMMALHKLVLLALVLGLGYASQPLPSTDDSYGYMGDWNSQGWPPIGNRLKKCIEIPTNLSLCRDIGYKEMRLPNLLNHDSIAEVTQQAKSWVPLMNIRCHHNTQLFLCSLFSPVCLPQPIYPCRSLCETVKQGCEMRMKKYGYDWPDMVRCDRFPEDNDLCIPPQNKTKPEEKTCQACEQPDTFEGIVDNYCSADFVGRMVIRKRVESGEDLKITVAKKKRYYKKGKQLQRRDLRSTEFILIHGATCHCGLFAGKDNKKARRKYLVMGVKRDGVLQVTLLQKFGKDQRRAIRRIRKKPRVCHEGLEGLADDSTVTQKSNRPTSTKSTVGPTQPRKKHRRSRKSRGKSSS